MWKSILHVAWNCKYSRKLLHIIENSLKFQLYHIMHFPQCWNANSTTKVKHSYTNRTFHDDMIETLISSFSWIDIPQTQQLESLNHVNIKNFYIEKWKKLWNISMWCWIFEINDLNVNSLILNNNNPATLILKKKMNISL